MSPASRHCCQVALSRAKHLLGPITGSVLFFASLWTLHHLLVDYRYAEVSAELRALSQRQVINALLLTALSYLTMSFYDVLAIRYIGNPLPWTKVGFASAVSYAFSNTVGISILTSTSVRYRLYTSWGLSTLDIGKVIAFCTLTFWLGLLTTAGSVLLVKGHPLTQELNLPRGQWLGAALITLPLLYLQICARSRRELYWGGQSFALPGFRIAATQIALGALDWILAGSVLFTLMPEQLDTGLLQFLGIYLIAQIVSLISHVPGGLGVFESLILLMMPKALSSASLLGAILAYRLTYYFIPLAIAASALASYEFLRRNRRLAGAIKQVGPWISELVPQIFAVWAILSGAVMLFSGATPSILERMEWLSDLLPLPLLEISHFFGSLVGVSLLLLARGLQRRLDGAWFATVTLLSAGIVFSMLKGADYEEALILMILLAALLPARSQFYRRSSLFEERFSSGWVLSIVVLLACSTWLGLFSYKHVDYAHELWWQFSFGAAGDAPRFMRAQVGVLVLSLSFAISRLLRPLPFEPSPPQVEDLAKASNIVATRPETYPNLALLGDKNLLFSSNDDGFLMYGVEGRSWVAMGDPVGPLAVQRELAWRFREISELYDGWTVFYQVRPENLSLYVDLGLSLLKIGEEARVDLLEFNLEGKSKKNLRNVQHKLERDGYRFEIIPEAAVPQWLPDMKVVSDAWLADRGSREKRFSLGFFDDAYLLRNPVAVIFKGSQVVAFANLWLSAGLREASVDLMRYVPGLDNGIMDFLFVNLMAWAKREGFCGFNLGMAPLSGLPDHALASTWNRFGSAVFGRGERFYNFRGVRQYKEKFAPQWEARYLAVPRAHQLPRILLNLATLIAGSVRGIVRK
ncbi:bifunctional lysylphosphatidylglycerol flippase/synthetase MprF [Methyloterricola oryzae]|uniref:bifunctional lysylphosphatidylglycerol flippase/synthetase MprF n=1 Tax=Methyloterricola oryzae TaxID=1495050 RepID=UPI0005EADFC2|nr:bifunctional lysylphosphatidylglycerol flippase/synthetase MprF [Methyloterricola oryzae]